MKIPTLEEVEAYVKENGFHDVNPEKFWHYYESIGWLVGKKPMKQWKSAIVTWTKTTKASRQLHLMGNCECGCGCKPTMIVDGKGYAYERCVGRVKQRIQKPINMDMAKGLFQKVPDKPAPYKDRWKQLQELSDN